MEGISGREGSTSGSAGRIREVIGDARNVAELKTVVPRAVPEQFTDASFCGWKLFYIEGTVRGTTELKIERKFYYGRGFLQFGI